MRAGDVVRGGESWQMRRDGPTTRSRVARDLAHMLFELTRVERRHNDSPGQYLRRVREVMPWVGAPADELEAARVDAERRFEDALRAKRAAENPPPPPPPPSAEVRAEVHVPGVVADLRAAGCDGAYGCASPIWCAEHGCQEPAE